MQEKRKILEKKFKIEQDLPKTQGGNMQLRDYLHIKRIKKQDFAAKVRYTVGYIGKVVELIKRPGRKLAEDIERVTKGEVTVEEMLSQVYESDKEIKKGRTVRP